MCRGDFIVISGATQLEHEVRSRMRTDLREILHKKVIEAAAKIDGKLPEHPSHPYGRIPVAHIYHVIQSVMEKPARYCSDDRFDEIIEIIDFCVENVEQMHIVRQIKHKYQPEPNDTEQNSLKDFIDDD